MIIAETSSRKLLFTNQRAQELLGTRRIRALDRGTARRARAPGAGGRVDDGQRDRGHPRRRLARHRLAQRRARARRGRRDRRRRRHPLRPHRAPPARGSARVPGRGQRRAHRDARPAAHAVRARRARGAAARRLVHDRHARPRRDPQRRRRPLGSRDRAPGPPPARAPPRQGAGLEWRLCGARHRPLAAHPRRPGLAGRSRRRPTRSCSRSRACSACAPRSWRRSRVADACSAPSRWPRRNPGGSFSEQDLAIAEDLARRAALAIENARLYGAEHDIAHALQQSLLPGTLTQPPGAEIAARYRPGRRGRRGRRRLLRHLADRRRHFLAIGDVAGHGPAAAALTSLTRQAMRVVSRYEGSPGRILAVVNDTIRAQSAPEQFCTAALATLRPTDDGYLLTVACAGHPPPVIVRAANGRARGDRRLRRAARRDRRPRVRRSRMPARSSATWSRSGPTA